MRTARVVPLVLVCTAFMLVCGWSGALAGGPAATVTDASGNTVSLTKLSTTELVFHVGNADRTIPVSLIRRIEAMPTAGRLKMTLTSGETMEGTSEGSLAGEWELGEYKLPLAKMKVVAFPAAEGGTGACPWQQPPGYVADVDGTVMYGAQYEYSYTAHDRMWFPPKPYTDTKTMLWLPIRKGGALYYVPFARIRSATASSITLTDGTSLSGQVFATGAEEAFQGWDRKIMGLTRQGEIRIALSKAKRVVFLHDQDLQVSKVEAERQLIYGGTFRSQSKLAGVVTTRENVAMRVAGLEAVLVETGHRFTKGTTIGLQIGEGLSTAELGKLQSIQGGGADPESNPYSPTVRATIITKAGSRLTVKFEKPNLYFGGECKEGYVLVKATEVKSVEIE